MACSFATRAVDVGSKRGDHMSGALEFVATKLDTLGYRLSLLNEVERLRAKGRRFPSNILSLIMTAPTRYDDFVQLAGFFDCSKEVNLIDIGANHGEFAKDFSLFFPNNRFIYCFEPNRKLRPILKECLHDLANVEIFSVGLGDKKEELSLMVPEIGDGLSSFLRYNQNVNEFYSVDKGEEQVVSVDTLDNVVGDIGGTVIVKIDTQGFELKVLAGGKKVIGKCDAVLMECSFAPVHEGVEPTFNPCNAILSDLGFAPVIFQRYGTQVNTYAFERDVLYVKKNLADKVFHRNS